MLAQRQSQASGGGKRRDERHKVLIRARMRAGGRPVDVCIRDVSLRGVCVVSENPPPRGTVVELAGPVVPIVGEVVWSSERRFGVSVGGRIDLPRLLAHRPSGPAPHETVPLPAYARAPEVKLAPEERSRNRGKTMEFVATIAIGAAAAVAICGLVYEQLTQASGRISSALETHP